MKIEIGRKSAEGWGLRSISWRFILANIESGAGLFMLVAGLNCTFVTLRCYARSVSTIGKTGQPTYIYMYIYVIILIYINICGQRDRKESLPPVQLLPFASSRNAFAMTQSMSIVG